MSNNLKLILVLFKFWRRSCWLSLSSQCMVPMCLWHCLFSEPAAKLLKIRIATTTFVASIIVQDVHPCMGPWWRVHRVQIHQGRLTLRRWRRLKIHRHTHKYMSNTMRWLWGVHQVQSHQGRLARQCCYHGLKQSCHHGKGSSKFPTSVCTFTWKRAEPEPVKSWTFCADWG